MRVGGKFSHLAEAQRRIAESQDQLLSMSRLGTCNQDIQHRFQGIPGPQAPHQQTGPSIKETIELLEDKKLEVSPVADRECAFPASLGDLCQHLQSRINEHSVIHCTPAAEDHQALVTVITSELGLIWPDLQQQMCDPALTSAENRELRSRTVEEVLQRCRQLYLNYLHLLDTLRRRAVFSDEANRCRVVAQLSGDCSGLLNVHSIQRSVAAGIKAKRRDWLVTERFGVGCGLRGDLAPHAKAFRRETSEPDTNRDIREITEMIGEVDLEGVYNLMPHHLEKRPSIGEAHTHYTQLVDSPAGIASKSDQERQIWSRHYTRLKGCSSMPDLQRETVLEMEPLPHRPLSPVVLLQQTVPTSNQNIPLDPAEDLRRLVQEGVDESVTEGDLPPLIQALPWTASSSLQQLRETLQRLEEKEEERRRARSKVVITEQDHPQGDVVAVALALPCSPPQTLPLPEAQHGTSYPGRSQARLGAQAQAQGTVARTAAARVSNRILPETIDIRMHPPVYNHLTDELTPSTVTWLDRNIFPGEDIQEVYRELSKSISAMKQYLRFDEDPMFEPVLTETKTTCSAKQTNRGELLNSKLKKLHPHALSHRKMGEISADYMKPADPNSRAYAAWLQRWKANFSLEDYLQYIDHQGTDFLSTISHLYDSSDSDDEEDKKTNLYLSRREEKLKHRREKSEALRRKKQEYVMGVWNVNTVLLGGLGKEPSPDDEEDGTDEEIMATDQEVPQRGGKGAAGLEGEQIQSRLERIWTTLCLPQAHRLDMAIKYSSPSYRDKLEEATAAWEEAARLVLQRESLMARLEFFERDASDPDRFFQNGYRGTSAARMEECRKRRELDSQISSVEKRLSKVVGHIAGRFHDTVSYKGRPYGEKMRWDRIEMLYWLQQERRVQNLQRMMEGRRVSLPARLPPLHPSCHQENPATHPTPRGHTPTPSQRTQEQITKLSISSIYLQAGNK